MMDCARCQDLLLDYLDGTLDEETIKEVQAELQHCAECRAVEAQLRTGLGLAAELPVAPMPDSLRARLMAAAEAHTEDKTPEASAKPPAAGGFLGGLFQPLQALLSGPQAAMATLLVLIVAGSVFVAPVLLPSPETVSAPEAASEVPVEEPAPTAPVPLQPEESRDEGESIEAAGAADAVAEAAASDTASGAPRGPSGLQDVQRYGAREKSASRPQLERSIKGKATVRSAGSPSASSERARAKRTTSATASRKARSKPHDDDAVSSELGQLEARSAPARSGSGAASTLQEEGAYAPPPPAVKDAEQTPPKKTQRPEIDDLLDNAMGAAPAPGSAREPAPEPENAYERGMAAYRSADYGTAAGLLAKALNVAQTRTERNMARRYLALSLKRLGRCQQALHHFRRLLEDAPIQWRAALVRDAAACYERLGLKEEAERLRERYR